MKIILFLKLFLLYSWIWFRTKRWSMNWTNVDIYYCRMFLFVVSLVVISKRIRWWKQVFLIFSLLTFYFSYLFFPFFPYFSQLVIFPNGKDDKQKIHVHVIPCHFEWYCNLLQNLSFSTALTRICIFDRQVIEVFEYHKQNWNDD